MKKWKRIALLFFAVMTAILTEAGNSGSFYAEELLRSSSETEAAASKGRSGTVRIDYKDDSGGTIPIQGAEFTFWKIEKNGKSIAARVRTNQNGEAMLSLPEGIYEVEETKPAAGHEASATFRFSIPMKEGKGQKNYDITITPKAIHRSKKTTVLKEKVPERRIQKRNKVNGKKAESVQKMQKTLPVRTSDSGSWALELIVLGSAGVVILVMIQMRRKGRRHE
jgi:hypothetical protein